MTNKGLRRILIAIILITSVSLTTFFWVLSSGTFAPESEEQVAYFVSQAWVFDGDSLLPNRQNVRIEAGEITCVGDTCQAKPGDIQVEGRDKTLLPGLIDQYVQFYAPGRETEDQGGMEGLLDFTQQRPVVRRNLVRAGITSIRSVGDVPDNIYLLENQIISAEMAGPRIFPAGPFITARGGHPAATRYAGNDPLIQQGTRQLDLASEADAIVKDLYGKGMIGVHLVYDDRDGKVPKLDSLVIQEVIKAAKQRGLWISAQASQEADLVNLARWGARTLFFSGGIESPGQLAPLTEQDVWVVPITEFDQTNFQPIPYPLLDSMGISVGVGSGQHHGQHRFGEALHVAISAQLKAGRQPIPMLRALTLDAARALKADDRIGKVAKGMQADLILVEGQVWEDPLRIARPDWVMAQGRVLVRNGQIVED